MTYRTKMSEHAREPFVIDWTEFYVRHELDPLVDTITSSVWVVTNATAEDEFLATPKTALFVEPTVGVGQFITAENRIEINGGAYKDCRTLRIEVF